MGSSRLLPPLPLALDQGRAETVTVELCDGFKTAQKWRQTWLDKWHLSKQD
jgi:hypothetical protein